MKRKISMLLIATAFIGIMSSCFKTEDPAFGIYNGDFYVIQTNKPNGSKSFKPYAMFLLNEDAATTPSMVSTNSAYDYLTLNKINNSLYTTSENQIVSFDTLPMDNFVIKGQNTANEAFTYEIPYSVLTMKDTLGAMEITEPKYDGKALHFKINDVAKATNYAVVCYSPDKKIRYRFSFPYESNKIVTLEGLVQGELYQVKISAGNNQGVCLETDIFPITAGNPIE